MKKNIGSVLALYPTPMVIVGAMVDGKPNWTLVGHVGIIGHDRVMVSMAAPHHSNKGIKESRRLSINVVDEQILRKADYVGSVSGAASDKSGVFEFTVDGEGAPMINEAKISMACTVEDIYNTPNFESFICKIDATYAEETVLNEKNKIDYRVFKPVLFEMPSYEYLKTGELIGKCLKLGSES